MPLPFLAWAAGAAVLGSLAYVASESDSNSNSSSNSDRSSYDEENRKEKEHARQEAEKAEKKEKYRIKLESLKKRSIAFVDIYYSSHSSRAQFKKDITSATRVEEVKNIVERIDDNYMPPEISNINKETAKLKIKDRELTQSIKLLKGWANK